MMLGVPRWLILATAKAHAKYLWRRITKNPAWFESFVDAARTWGALSEIGGVASSRRTGVTHSIPRPNEERQRRPVCCVHATRSFCSVPEAKGSTNVSVLASSSDVASYRSTHILGRIRFCLLQESESPPTIGSAHRGRRNAGLVSDISGVVSLCPSANRPSTDVVIPVYNGQAGIANAIRSVLAQTYDNFELTIANNCIPMARRRLRRNLLARTRGFASTTRRNSSRWWIATTGRSP